MVRMTLGATAALAFLPALGFSAPKEKPAPTSQRVFQHPGITNSQKDLEELSQRISTDPFVKAGWEQLLKSKVSKLSYQPNPHAITVVRGSGATDQERDIHRDAIASYSHALQWVATGNKAHSDKAIEILNAWSAVLKDVVSEEGSPGVQDKLEVAWYGPLFLSAAEIIRHFDDGQAGWPEKDIEQFDRMLLIFKEKSLAWNGSGSCPNQGISVALHRMSLGVYTNDPQLYQSGYQLFVDKILKTKNKVTNTILPSGEIWEINRKKGGDFGHASYNIEGVLNIAELAWIQGDDIYGIKIDGEKLPRILKGTEYMAKLVIDGPVPSTKEGMLSKPQLKLVGMELGYNHYTNRCKGYQLPYTKRFLKEKRPSNSGSGKFFHWDTLTHANLSNSK